MLNDFLFDPGQELISFSGIVDMGALDVLHTPTPKFGLELPFQEAGGGSRLQIQEFKKGLRDKYSDKRKGPVILAEIRCLFSFVARTLKSTLAHTRGRVTMNVSP